MKKVNEVVILTSSFIILVYLVLSIFKMDITTILLCIALFLVLNIFKIIKMRINKNLKSVFYIFFFLSGILGSLVGLYGYIWFYDILMHFTSGVIITYIAYYLLNYHDVNIKHFNEMYIVSFNLALALLWELFEFFIDTILSLDTQKVLTTGINDTMEDIIAAILGMLLYVFYKKYLQRRHLQTL